jgi:peptide-methionine (R)-S-oxide reductase
MSENEDKWKLTLSPEQYKVLRECGTEPPFTGKYVNHKENGIYVCAACGSELFSSDTKYESGSGWPSFWDQVSEDAIERREDNSLWMKRIEIVCKKCGGHLGHVFDDGPNPTGLRYCVNSLSLDFKKIDTE